MVYLFVVSFHSRDGKICLYNFIERSGCISDMMPSSLQRRVMPMNTMEVLVIFILHKTPYGPAIFKCCASIGCF